jgi:hypothetical protein
MFPLRRLDMDVACLKIEHRDLNVLVDNVARDKVSPRVFLPLKVHKREIF